MREILPCGCQRDDVFVSMCLRHGFLAGLQREAELSPGDAETLLRAVRSGRVQAWLAKNPGFVEAREP